MTPMIKTGLLHAGSAVAGAWAGISFAASHGVDLYAIYDQLNVVIADVTKLLAMLAPLATGAWAVFQRTRKGILTEAASDPSVRGIVTTPAVAASIPSDKVQPTVAALPVAAQLSALEPAKA